MGRKGISGVEYDDEGSYSDDFEEVEEDIQESRNASPGKASRAATSGKVNRPVTFAADLSSSGILELPWLSPPPSRMVRSGKSQGKDRQFELFSRGDSTRSACPSEPGESICPEEGLASRPFSVVTPMHPRDESYVALEALGMQPITPASAKNRIYAEYIEDDFDDYGINFGPLSARGSGKLPGDDECGIMTPKRPEIEGERGLSAPGTTREEWKNREASPEKQCASPVVQRNLTGRSCFARQFDSAVGASPLSRSLSVAPTRSELVMAPSTDLQTFSSTDSGGGVRIQRRTGVGAHPPGTGRGPTYGSGTSSTRGARPPSQDKRVHRSCNYKSPGHRPP